MQIRTVGAECFHAEGHGEANSHFTVGAECFHAEGHGEANSHFPQFRERP